MNRRIYPALFGLVLAVLFSACMYPLSQERGSLIINLEEASSGRAVFPFEQGLSLVDHYDFILTSPDGAIETLSNVTDTSIEKSYLAPGVWKVEVVAKNSAGNVLGRGYAEGEVKAASATRLNIKVRPSGEGMITVDVTWEGNSLVKEGMALTAALLAEDETAYIPVTMTESDTGAKYEARLGSGTWNILLQLKDSKENVVWGFVETFHLYEDLTTSETYIIREEDMNAPPDSAPKFMKVDRGHDRVLLEWDEGSPRAERYALQRKTAGTDWVSVTTLSYGTLSWTDTGLTPSTSYRYRIRGENFFGESLWSEEMEITTIPLKEVGGRLSGDSVWTKDVVYKVKSHLLVPDGITLRIMPGTKVMFEPGIYLQVEGELIAKGTPSAPIYLGYASYGWGYIGFVSTSTDASFINGNYASGSILQHVIIRGGGRIGIEQARPFLDHLDIEGSSGNAISANLDGDTIDGLKITNSRFGYTNDWNIRLNGNGLVTLTDNTIEGSNGIYSSGEYRYGSVFARNSFTGSGTGINLNYSTRAYTDNPWQIINNRFIYDSDGSGLSGEAIRLQYGEFVNGIIKGNYIQNKTNGIYFYPYYLDGLTLEGNGIVHCGNGIVFIANGGEISANMVLKDNMIIDSTSVGLHYNQYLSSSNSFIATGNYFDNSSARYEVELGDNMRKPGTTVLNLTNNYWNTNDVESIRKRIFDTGMDFQFGKVEIEPIASLNGVQVVPISPASGWTAPDSRIDFRWITIGRAATYDLQIASDSAFKNILLTKNGIFGNSFTLGSEVSGTGMKDGSTYYWRIAGVKADSTRSPWSSGRYFKLALSVPLPVSPVDGETLYDGYTPKLVWQPSAGALAYRLVVDDDAAFSSPVADVVIQNASEYQFVSELVPDRTYYWKVYARDMNGIESAASDAQAFVLPPPGIVVRMNPDLPGPQHLSIEGPAVAIWGQYLSYVAKSDNAMDRYVWTLNGEKIAETFIPTLYFQASAYQPGFYTLGMTAWKDGYPYSSYQSLRIARDGAGIQ